MGQGEAAKMVLVFLTVGKQHITEECHKALILQLLCDITVGGMWVLTWRRVAMRLGLAPGLGP